MAKGNSSYGIDWKKIFLLQIKRLAHSMRLSGEIGKLEIGDTHKGSRRDQGCGEHYIERQWIVALHLCQTASSTCGGEGAGPTYQNRERTRANRKNFQKGLTIYTVCGTVYVVHYMTNGRQTGVELFETLKLELRRGCLVVAFLAQLRKEQHGSTLRKALP